MKEYRLYWAPLDLAAHVVAVSKEEAKRKFEEIIKVSVKPADLFIWEGEELSDCIIVEADREGWILCPRCGAVLAAIFGEYYTDIRKDVLSAVNDTAEDFYCFACRFYTSQRLKLAE